MPAPRSLHPDIADRYDVKETIGSGGFAKVKVGRHKLTGMQVAIKIMDKAGLGDDLPRAYLEIRTLKELRHQHICQLYEVVETKERLYLILEFAPGGELFDYIVAQDRLKEQEARKFFRQVISAVAYVHSKGYAHRDLKPENLLLDEHQNIKLIDFGLVAHPSSLDMPLATCCGSPAYAAPELIQARPYLGTEADVWSLGVLLYALLCGFLPFDDDNTAILYSLIKRGKYDIPNWLSQLSVKFLGELIVLEPKRRLSIGGVITHPWMNKAYDKPVDHTSVYEEEEYDGDVVKEICRAYGRTEESVVAELKTWKYDSFTATYFLLHKMKQAGKRPALKVQPPPRESLNPLRSPGTPTGSPLPKFRLQSFDDSNSMYFSMESLPGSDVEESAPRSPAPNRRATDTGDHRQRPASSIEASNNKSPVNLFLQKHGGGRGAGRSHSVDESLDKSAASAPPDSNYLGGDDDAFKSGSEALLAPALSARHRAASVDERLNQLSLGGPGSHGRASVGAAATLPQGTNPTSALAGLATPSRSRKHGATLTHPQEQSQSGTLEKGGFRGSLNRIVANVRDSLGSSSSPGKGPRKVKALYNVQTTSTKTAEEVLSELQRVVKEEQIVHRVKGYVIRCKTLGKDGKVNLSFDMEVCQLPRMDLIGISRKRIKGDTWLYKTTCERLLSAAHL
eukprot:scpid32178/ scgid21544/ Maternal embryonic leucine zipper kinase